MLPSAPGSRGASIRSWIAGTFSGRALVAGALVKIAAFLIGLATGPSTAVALIDTFGDLALIAGALVLGFRLFVDLKQQLLWRVRRKLTVSYIFIGFVPALLIIVFFLVSGLLLFFNVAGYMTHRQLEEMVDQTRFVAESAAVALSRTARVADAVEILERREAAIASRYPGASMALVAAAKTCGRGTVALPAAAITVGPWTHLPAPTSMPEWIPCEGHRGLVTYPDGDRTRIAARAAVWPDGANRAVVVDVPLDESFARELRDEAGIELGFVATVTEDEVNVPASGQSPGILVGPANIDLGDQTPGMRWVTLVDYPEWETGKALTLMVSFAMSPRAIYNRIATTSARGVEGFTVGEALLLVLALVGVLFLIIQAVAFSMGLALARSITGSIHELFAGTERVRRGDFTGRVAIRSRDQLGELAESFNSMTSSIEDLLQQKAEKERLEQELRIARAIQMSLLPQGPLGVRGATVIAHCEPAREVGGDYYDFLTIDEHTVGILVADVSGKGTSAALYMAELKGIVLSLSQRFTSPRELLIEADRIISRHLDSRSFITVTYLVVDLEAGIVRYARAGHCPLIFVPGPHAASRTPRLLLPDGLVLGLQLDEGRTFAKLLEEVTLPLGPGDLFLLYTDGISEAMNTDGDCFGDARLADIVGAHADLPPDELRERILREIGAFAGSAPQHDDMTMLVLRVEEVGARAAMAAAASR